MIGGIGDRILPSIGRALATAVYTFIIIGIFIPIAVDYLRPQLSSYAPLPSSLEVWSIFPIFGAAFASTGALQSGYSKGDYGWLIGKIAEGILGFAFYTYLLRFLPNSLTLQNIQAPWLLWLIDAIYLLFVLSYVFMIFDFYRTRRRLKDTRG